MTHVSFLLILLHCSYFFFSIFRSRWVNVGLIFNDSLINLVSWSLIWLHFHYHSIVYKVFLLLLYFVLIPFQTHNIILTSTLLQHLYLSPRSSNNTTAPPLSISAPPHPESLYHASFVFALLSPLFTASNNSLYSYPLFSILFISLILHSLM